MSGTAEQFLQGAIGEKDGDESSKGISKTCMQSAFALILLLQRGCASLSQEFGNRAWKLGWKRGFHPLAYILFCNNLAMTVRLHALVEWIKLTAKGVFCLDTFRIACFRGAITWGSPAVLSRLFSALSFIFVGHFRRKDTILDIGEETDAVEAVALAFSFTSAVFRNTLPNIVIAFIYEAARRTFGNLVLKEGFLQEMLAFSITPLVPWLTYSRGLRSKMFRLLLQYVSSAVVWKRLEGAGINPSNLILAVGCCYMVPLNILWGYARVKLLLA